MTSCLYPLCMLIAMTNPFKACKYVIDLLTRSEYRGTYEMVKLSER